MGKIITSSWPLSREVQNMTLNRKDDSEETVSRISKPLETLLRLEEGAETFPKELCYGEIAGGFKDVLVSLIE